MWLDLSHIIKCFLGGCSYLAPEYAENGTVSIRTDVYAFGIVLLQLISGRKIVDSKKDEHPQSLREWVMNEPRDNIFLFFLVMIYSVRKF